MPRLLTALRDHLVSEGLVRIPRDVGTAPPMWLQPRNGTPGPGETPQNATGVEIGPDLVCGAYVSGGLTVPRFGSFARRPTVEVHLRARSAPLAEDLEAQITARLIDRTNWTMGGLAIIESMHWRALTPIASDAQSFDFLVAYLFELYTDPDALPGP
jgi:hypothetical protein